VIHSFAAVVTGADVTSPDSPDADALYEAGRDDALLTSDSGVQRDIFDREAPSVAAAVASAITAIETTITGARVTAAQPLDPPGLHHYRSPPKHPGIRLGPVSCQPSERPLDVPAGSDRRRIPAVSSSGRCPGSPAGRARQVPHARGRSNVFQPSDPYSQAACRPVLTLRAARSGAGEGHRFVR
jgi:hypothetical protein